MRRIMGRLMRSGVKEMSHAGRVSRCRIRPFALTCVASVLSATERLSMRRERRVPCASREASQAVVKGRRAGRRAAKSAGVTVALKPLTA